MIKAWRPVAISALVLALSCAGEAASQSTGYVVLRCDISDGNGLPGVSIHKIGNGQWFTWVNSSNWHEHNCASPRFATCETTPDDYILNTQYPGSEIWAQTVINRRTGAFWRRSNDPQVYTGTCQVGAEPVVPPQRF